MKLKSPASWLAFIEKMRDRGATGLEIEVSDTGAIKSLKCQMRQPLPAALAPRQRPTEAMRAELEQKLPRKPAPAGLGYD